MPPHVFAIADKAFRDMKVLKSSQSYFLIRDNLPLLNFLRQLCSCLYIYVFFCNISINCRQIPGHNASARFCHSRQGFSRHESTQVFSIYHRVGRVWCRKDRIYQGSDFVFKIFSQSSQILPHERNWVKMTKAKSWAICKTSILEWWDWPKIIFCLLHYKVTNECFCRHLQVI